MTNGKVPPYSRQPRRPQFQHRGGFVHADLHALLVSRKINGVELALLLDIDNYVKADGPGCYESNRHLGERYGMTGRQVQRVVTKLVGLGLILLTGFIEIGDKKLRLMETAWSRLHLKRRGVSCTPAPMTLDVTCTPAPMTLDVTCTPAPMTLDVTPPMTSSVTQIEPSLRSGSTVFKSERGCSGAKAVSLRSPVAPPPVEDEIDWENLPVSPSPSTGSDVEASSLRSPPSPAQSPTDEDDEDWDAPPKHGRVIKPAIIVPEVAPLKRVKTEEASGSLRSPSEPNPPSAVKRAKPSPLFGKEATSVEPWDARCARILHDAINGAFGLGAVFNAKRQSAVFRSMRADRTEEAISRVLDWYAINTSVWRVQGADSFKRHFEVIEGKMLRDTKTTPAPFSAPLDPEAADILNTLRPGGWPKGSGEQLPAEVSQSLAACRRFMARIREVRENPTAYAAAGDRSCWPAFIDGFLGFYVGITVESILVRWYRKVWKQASAWHDWSGDLTSFRFSIRHKWFVQAVREHSSTYSGSRVLGESLLNALAPAG